MENVTKALLIVAAVLIAILLISLAMILVNKGDVSEDASGSLNSMSIKTFNSKYEAHEGLCFGSTVKKILGYAIKDNEKLFGDSQKDASTIDYCINIRSNDKDLLKRFKGNNSMISALDGTRSYGVRYTENITSIQKVINKGQKFKVWFSYNEKTGYIWEIHIDSIGD